MKNKKISLEIFHFAEHIADRCQLVEGCVENLQLDQLLNIFS